MSKVPPAPWQLTGQAIALLEGSQVRLLVHYESSPVGPYDEFALAKLTRRGPSVVEMLVTIEASRQGGRANWGFPKEIAALDWQNDENRAIFRAPGRVLRFRAFGPRFALQLRFWTAQTLENRPVRVPGHRQAQARLAFRGRQMALWLEKFEMNIEPPQPRP